MKTFISLFVAAVMFSQVTDNVFKYSSKDLKEAKSLSYESGKSLLIYYTADWCLPCQMMEESTFQDQYLIEKMKEKYVTVEIDRDDLESVEIIEKYNICCLPTLQLINSAGEVIVVNEGTLSREDFYSFLDIHQPQSSSMVSNDIPSGEKVHIESNDSHRTEMTNNAEAIETKIEGTNTSGFTPGRVEVNENTYAEMKAKAVKEGVPDSQIVDEKSPEYSTQSVPAGKIVDGKPEQITAEEVVVKAPKSSMMEAEVVASNKKSSSKSKTSTKEVKAGKIGSSEMVVVAEDIREAPSSTYVEEEELKEKTNHVNEKVAEDLISILSEVDETDEIGPDPTEVELAQMKSQSEKVSVKNVSATEEVTIKTIKRPSGVEVKDDVKLAYDVDMDELDKEKIRETISRKVEYIQAGAFRNILNADALRTKLLQKADDIIVIEADNKDCDDRKLYKVLIGPVATPDQRKEVVNSLSDIGIVGFSVII